MEQSYKKISEKSISIGTTYCQSQGIFRNNKLELEDSSRHVVKSLFSMYCPSYLGQKLRRGCFKFSHGFWSPIYIWPWVHRPWASLGIPAVPLCQAHPASLTREDSYDSLLPRLRP